MLLTVEIFDHSKIKIKTTRWKVSGQASSMMTQLGRPADLDHLLISVIIETNFGQSKDTIRITTEFKM